MILHAKNPCVFLVHVREETLRTRLFVPRRRHYVDPILSSAWSTHFRRKGYAEGVFLRTALSLGEVLVDAPVLYSLGRSPKLPLRILTLFDIYSPWHPLHDRPVDFPTHFSSLLRGLRDRCTL